MTIIEEKLQWGSNYGFGFSAFLSRKEDFISYGIDWFTRWSDLPGTPPISHTFIIAGEDRTIEAFGDGVHDGRLKAYLDNPDVAVLVRKPIKWSDQMGQRIVAEAAKHIGEEYNYKLIAALALSNSIVGHFLNKLSKGELQTFLTRLVDSPHKEICSKLVALANEAQSEIGHLGCLANLSCEITPAMLFNDAFIYDPGAVELVP